MVEHGILHVHSYFSLHDSTQSPEIIIKRAKEIGCQHITLTDHVTLMGIDDFMDAGKQYGINAIPGVEMYMENRYHLVMIAKNYKGFQAISKALRDANEHQYIREMQGFRFVYPIMTKEIMESLRGNPDIIVTSACIQGPVAAILLKHYYTEKEKNKIHAKMQLLEEDVAAYKKTSEAYTSLTQKYKEYSATRTQFLRYTKDTYQNQIQRKKERLESQKQLLLDFPEMKTEKEQKKYTQLLEKIQKAENEKNHPAKEKGSGDTK